MLGNIFSRLEALGIAGDAFLAGLLVDTDVVNVHGGGEVETVFEDLGPARAHGEIEDHGHWLLGNDARSHVAIGSNSTPIHLPRFVVADEPLDLALGALTGHVLEAVLLILLFAVPIVIEQCRAADGLLIRTARPVCGEGEVSTGDCSIGRVGLLPDIKGCNLV